MNRKPSLALSLATAAALLLAACSPGPDKAAAPAAAPAPTTTPATPADSRPVLYWYDPMVPDKHFDKPGKSPFMDMQLVPKYADEPSSATPPSAGKDAMPGKPQ